MKAVGKRYTFEKVKVSMAGIRLEGLEGSCGDENEVREVSRSQGLKGIEGNVSLGQKTFEMF